MITIEPVQKHLHDKNFLKNHARWRNDSLVWTRENKKTDHSAQYRYFSNLKQDREFFVILNQGEIVGVCGLTEISLLNQNAEFSLLIGAEFQRQGFGSLALKELLHYGFTTLALHLIFGQTFRYPCIYGINPGAKAYEKIGFSLDGILRQRYLKERQWVDAMIFSIKRDEFLLKYKA